MLFRSYDDGAGPGLDETFSGNWADTVVGFHNLAMTVSTRAQANGDGTVLLNVDRITLDGTPPGGGVTPAIPEPASLGLVGLALMGLAGSRRNRR